MLKFINNLAKNGHNYLANHYRRSNHVINLFGHRQQQQQQYRYIVSGILNDLNDPNKSYVHGQPPSTNSQIFSPLTIGQLLKRTVKIVDPNHIGFIVEHQNIEKTYQQFDEDVSFFFISNQNH